MSVKLWWQQIRMLSSLGLFQRSSDKGALISSRAPTGLSMLR